MADEPNIFEQGLKNTQEFVDDNITGSLSDLTNKASVKIAETGAMKENQARGVLPWLAGGLITAVGFMLMGPINSVVKGIFSLIKNVVTGFGLFEKIPVIGEAFTWLGKGVETIGKYAGYAAPLIAGFIGYKALETKANPNPAPQTALEKAAAAVEQTVDEAGLAVAGSTAAAAIGRQAGLQTRGRRTEIIRTVIEGQGDPGSPASPKQIARMQTLLGEEGFAQMHKALFNTEPANGRIDTRLTKAAANNLIHQIEGLSSEATQARIKEIEGEMPKRGVVRAAINKTPGVGAVAEMVSPDAGLSGSERNAAAKVEAAKPEERALIKGRVVEQLVDDIGTVKTRLPAPAPADPFARTREQISGLQTTDAPDGVAQPRGNTGEVTPGRTATAVLDTPEPTPSRNEGMSRRDFLRGGPRTETVVADAPETAPIPKTPPPTPLPSAPAGEPVSAGRTSSAPATPQGAPPPKPGFWNGSPSTGASATMGAAAVLTAAHVLTDDDASTGAKIVAGATGATGATAVGAQLAGASKIAGVAGRAGGALAIPFAVHNSYQSFTKENATGEDYLEGGIQAGYAAGGAMMLTGVGFVPGAVTVIGAGATDIGHKGYKIGKGLYEISEMKDYIDSGFVPDRRAAAALASVQGRLHEQLSARGVKQIPWGEDGNTMFDLRDPKDAQMAREELIKARDEAEQRMDDNNITLLPRFFYFTENQRRKQDRFESARLDYKGYEQALAEFDWYLEDQRTRLHQHEHKAGPPAPPPEPTELDLGGLTMNNSLPSNTPPAAKDKGQGNTQGSSGPSAT